MKPEQKQLKKQMKFIMKIQLEIIGRKTIVTYNGKSKEHNTVWLKSLLLKDMLNLLEDGNL